MNLQIATEMKASSENNKYWIEPPTWANRCWLVDQVDFHLTFATYVAVKTDVISTFVFRFK